MTDSEIIEALATKCGGHVALAERLKVTRQTLWDWKRRGILPHSRLAVAALAAEVEIELPEGFTEASVTRQPPPIKAEPTKSPPLESSPSQHRGARAA